MLFEIFIGSAMIVLTTLIHGVFTMVGVEYMRDYVDRHHEPALIWSTLRLTVFVLWFFLATIIEVWSWAVLYVFLGAFQSIETAVYFSTVTFTTLGFGDIVPVSIRDHLEPTSSGEFRVANTKSLCCSFGFNLTSASLQGNNLHNFDHQPAGPALQYAFSDGQCL